MSLTDLFSMAIRNLAVRKLRTSLTLLGVMIGTTAIIVMISFGLGIKSQNEQMIQSMGDMTSLDVRKDDMFSQNPEPSDKKLNARALLDIKNIPHVAAASPVYTSTFEMKFRNFQNDYVSVTAIEPEAFDSFQWEMEKGHGISNSSQIEMVLGSQAVSGFYDPNSTTEGYFDEEGNIIDPPPPFEANGVKMEISQSGGAAMFPGMGSNLESTAEAKKAEIKIVGVLKEKKDYTVDYGAYMSIESYKNLLKQLDLEIPKSTEYETIKVKVDDIENVRDVEQEIKNMGFSAQGLFSILDSMNQVMNAISAIFAGIGAISFIVAAIGITNTMIMSIYERTREIGVMKVIGASIQDIQRLFLVEAGLIGLMGGAIGILFSLLLSTLFNFIGARFMSSMTGDEMASAVSIIPLWLIIVALLFSTFVGILAGYFPARRAMNLSALDAIRTE
ncbi:ABC transporter permease [Peptoniphilus sp. KCTC 25270]|uniref:ABC transporter permease n=1 Tax=Peptoniphilus sp. KCTC 25270 TaxID=2897414 RepID=UPI001E2DF461|nr:ABC transporter permease [Peptoniphilus sp. KCTC 25270]MCD1146791.1 ABC transporter permease [Peptoniphilus sp. KCTC 25270]